MQGAKETRTKQAVIDEVIETIEISQIFADLAYLHKLNWKLEIPRSATPVILSRMSLEMIRSGQVKRHQPYLSPFIEEQWQSCETRRFVMVLMLLREDFCFGAGPLAEREDGAVRSFFNLLREQRASVSEVKIMPSDK